MAGGVGGCGEGPLSVSLFAFCLPAEHRGVQESRDGKEREKRSNRRLIAAEPRTEPRHAAPRQPPCALHLAPVFGSGLGATIRKGVNRNGIIYVKRTWFRYTVQSIARGMSSRIFSLSPSPPRQDRFAPPFSVISILIPCD